ncbi:hypothetical protein [Ureibacillus sp. GCM10028918]|uniref:hypothetical protein n=1 Tax=Ureibacillus sp. GCM10028918 TaxID=3273429 RepID=UPI003612FA85
MSVFIIGCTDNTKHYVFKGEGEYWEVEYNYEITGESKDKYNLLIKYIGELEELSAVNDFSYSYTTSAGESSGSFIYEENEVTNKMQIGKSGASEGTPILQKDEVIEIIINWGDNVEVIELKNKGE